MAKPIDYLASLKDFRDSGGTDINEFLKKHATTPATLGARLKAADASSKINSTALQNVLAARAGGTTVAAANEPDLPPGAEGTYFQGPLANPKPGTSPAPRVAAAETDLPPGANGTFYQGPLANPKPSPTPSPQIAGFDGSRPLAPTVALAVGNAAAQIAGASDQIASAQTAAAPPAEKQWWQASSFDKDFQKFADNNNSQLEGRADRAASYIRLNKNTYIPATQSYNRSSSI